MASAASQAKPKQYPIPPHFCRAEPLLALRGNPATMAHKAKKVFGNPQVYKDTRDALAAKLQSETFEDDNGLPRRFTLDVKKSHEKYKLGAQFDARTPDTWPAHVLLADILSTWDVDVDGATMEAQLKALQGRKGWPQKIDDIQVVCADVIQLVYSGVQADRLTEASSSQISELIKRSVAANKRFAQELSAEIKRDVKVSDTYPACFALGEKDRFVFNVPLRIVNLVLTAPEVLTCSDDDSDADLTKIAASIKQEGSFDFASPSKRARV